MKRTILILRIFFFVLCLAGSFLLWYAAGDNPSDKENARQALAYYLTFGGLLGALTILIDVFLKGFSIRGLTALTFGLTMGSLIAFLLSTSPLFEEGDDETKYLSRLSLFIVCTYLGAVITLRGKDEFNLVIPYMRFVPQKVDVPVAVIDTSALIDGRIVGICNSGFLNAELVIPRFVIDELQRIANSSDQERRDKGRKGIQVLSELRKLEHMHVTINESEVEHRSQADAKIIFIAQSLHAKLLTVDFNLAKLAEVHGVQWMNLNALTRVLRTEVAIGEKFDVELVKHGKESDQAIGYLTDGSMVVVNDASQHIGQTVYVEVGSVLPSAGGKMIFGKIAK